MASTLRISAAALTVATVGLAGIWTGTDRSEGIIERSFASAFDRLEAASHPPTARPAFDPAHLHLSRLPAASAMASPLARGDRMTITGRSGSLTTYEVVELRPLPAGTGGAADADERMVMVTAVTVGQVPAQTIRFIVEAGSAPERVPAPAKPHAL